MKLKFTWMLTLFLALVQFSFAQEKNISGTVSDESGMPLPGVAVLVKGTSTGTQTDFDGKYTLKAMSGQTLVFSYLGMKSVERTVGSATTINVTLQEDAQALEEVVVLGYSVKSVSEVTGSSVQVSGDQIASVPVVSVDQALQGKVAGLNISMASGTPGSVQDIRIRRVGSINAGNDPLYVIDGVPVNNSNFSGSSAVSSFSALASLNSSDIESITVLKDASATSAYGARGSNGVIVITTKKGKSGKVSFTANSLVGFQNNAVEGRKPLTATQRMELLTDAFRNSRGYDNATAYAYALASTGWDEETDFNWGNAVKNKDAVMQNYDISASGGDENSSFYASLGYNATEATVIASDFERISGSFNFNRKFSDKFDFSTSMNVSNVTQNGILEQAAYFSNPHLVRFFMPPIESAYNADGSYNLNTSVFNPLYQETVDITENNLTRALNNTSLVWKINDRFRFKSVIGLDYTIASYHEYRNRYHGDSDGAVGGSVQNSVNRNFNYVTQNSLAYNFKVAQHSFDVQGLVEYQKNRRNFLTGFGQNLPADGLYYLDTAPGSQAVGGFFDDWSSISYLGMLNYNFDGKYVLDATFRREGSSRFAASNRFGSFWSLGAAWNIHREAFLSGNEIVNQLRLRASIGESGNSQIDINRFQNLLSYDANYNGLGAVYPSQYGNENLSWEMNKNYDLGFDFGLFENRVSGSFAYFNKKTYDLLQTVPLSYTSGHAGQVYNAGTVVNKGIEIELSADIIRGKDFSWSISGNYATVENEVIALAKDSDGEDINIITGTRAVEVGQPIYAWRMRKWAGVDPQTGRPQWYLNGKDGELTTNYFSAKEEYQGGSAMPTFTGGLSTNLEFKGFFLNASVYFAGGHKVFEDWAFYTQHSGVYTTLYYNGVQDMMSRWQKPGDVTDYPRMVYNATGDNASRTSTRFLYDGDYIRLKDITLGYNIPNRFVEKTGLEGIRVSLRGANY